MLVFISPEVPAPQSPYPYTRCARFESGARALIARRNWETTGADNSPLPPPMVPAL